MKKNSARAILVQKTIEEQNLYSSTTDVAEVDLPEDILKFYHEALEHDDPRNEALRRPAAERLRTDALKK